MRVVSERKGFFTLHAAYLSPWVRAFGLNLRPFAPGIPLSGEWLLTGPPLVELTSDASAPAFEADRKVKTALRKQLQRKIREVRKQLKRDIPKVPEIDAEQLSVLDDYALGTLTALNRDGSSPFDFAALQAVEDLDEIANSLQRREKKGQR